jgi:hypothetical protein
MNRRSHWQLVTLLLLGSVTGCGGPKLVKVTGRLTHKGEPVPNTQVYFAPEDGGRRSHGLTNEKGEFNLKFSRTEVGVTPGKHNVYLQYDAVQEEDPSKPKASKELKQVLAAYDQGKSELHYEVTKDGQNIEIELP